MKMKLCDVVLSANTGADAIRKAPIVDKDTGIRCLRIGDVSQGRDYAEWGFTETTSEVFARYQLKRDDIIIARTGNTIGVNTYISSDIQSVYNNGLIRIQCDTEKILPKFFYYLIRGKQCQDYVQSIAFGTSTQPNMKIKDFLSFEFEYLDIKKQEKIVSIIDALDQKIKLNTKLNANFEDVCSAIYKKTFIEDYQENWNKGTIADIGTVVGGSTPSKSKDEYYCENGIPWITPKDLSNNKNKFINRGSVDITEQGLQKSSTKIMPAGTVLFSSRAPIGYIAIAKNDVTTNQGFKSVVPNENIGTAYIYFLLKHNLEKIKNMASGSTFKEVSGTVMKNIEIVIPDSTTLNKFNMLCTSIFEQQKLIEEENLKLIDIRDTLLPKLMLGEIDLSGVELEL